jgi:paraquat-inducible protein A
MRTMPLTASRAGFMLCHACRLLSRPHARAPASACPRCGASLHLRKPDSIARTWAFLLAASILYVPANVLPIMHTDSVLGSQYDTIVSGVIFLWSTGSWPIAILIFFASVMVPLLKILGLVVLVVSVQRRSTWAPQQRTRLYRLVEFVGRWSMIDIFVVAILAALVQFQGLASIEAETGAVAFGAVVVLTMFAAEAFDPRLIWDPVRTPGETQ